MDGPTPIGDPWDEEDMWGVCWDFKRKSWGGQWSGGGGSWKSGWKSWESGPAAGKQVPHWAAYGESGESSSRRYQGQSWEGRQPTQHTGLSSSSPPWMPYSGAVPSMPAAPAGKGFLPQAEGPYIGDVAKAMAACVAKGKAKASGKGKQLMAPEGPFTGDCAGDMGPAAYGWQGPPGWWGGPGPAAPKGKGGWQGDWGKGGFAWDQPMWGAQEGGPPPGYAGFEEEQPPGLNAGKGRGGGGKSGRGGAHADPVELPGAGKAENKEGLLAQIDTVLQDPGCSLQRGDFDGRVRQFLASLRATGGPEKVQDALEMISSYTSQKSRASIGNWPAYLLTLLKRFEPDLAQKGRSRGKAGKGGPGPLPMVAEAGYGGGRGPMPAPEAAPPVSAAAPMHQPPSQPPQQPSPAHVEEETERREVLELPSGWEDGRKALLEEIDRALATLGGGKAPTCPFTGKVLTCQEALVSHVALCLGSAANDTTGDRSKGLTRHVAGLARSRDFAECPRAAAAAGVAGIRELAALPEDASAFDAAAAAGAAKRAQPLAAAVAGTILQEIGLELAAEMLRGHWLSPSTGKQAA